MAVTKSDFGKLADGRAVSCYTITNKNGASAAILDLGGTLQSLRVPDRDGNLRDVVLGYDTPQEYLDGTGYLGALIGRFGNRIGDSRFTLNGKTYTLFANDKNNNHLHGGKEGFDKKFWQVETGSDSVTLRYTSPDMEEGYPGNLAVTVTYRLDDDNRLTLDYTAETDADTVLNLTNHSYFNLSGEGSGSIAGQTLRLDADAYTAVDSYGLTVEQVIPVEGTPFDFRTAKPLGRDINQDDPQVKDGGGYDHNFALNGEVGTLRTVGEAFSPESGIKMEIATTQPGVQLYAANMLDPRPGKNGHTYSYREAFCLETQHFPNGMACPSFLPPVLRAGETYHEITVYGFTIA